MRGLLRVCFETLIQVAPYLAVFAVLKYIISVQGKMSEERKEEQEKGIIRGNYIIKSEKILVIVFIVGTLFFGGCAMIFALTIFCDIPIINKYVMKADMWCVYVFAAFALVSLAGVMNTAIWKLEVNGEEIAWRSTFGIVRRFRFEDITECEIGKRSILVYVNDKKMFHIDDNIDSKEFMEDVERHGVPVEYYLMKRYKKGKKRKKK